MARRSTKRPSAKQLAARRKFAQRFGGKKARKVRRRTTRTTTTAAAPKKRRSTSRRAAPVARRKTSRRRGGTRRRTVARRTSRRTVSRRGFVNADLLRSAGVSTAGFVAAEVLPARIPVAFLQQPGIGQAVGKAAVGLAGAMLLGKFLSKKDGNAFAVGAGVALGKDLAVKALQATGVAGVGAVYEIGPGVGGPALLTGGMNRGMGAVYEVPSQFVANR